MSEADTEFVLDVTDAALSKVLDVRATEDEAETLALRVEIIGQQGVDYTYDLTFQPKAEAEESDLVYEVLGLAIMIAGDSIEKIKGSTLDLPSNSAQGGLVIRNPNRPNLLENMDLDLSGSAAEKLQQLLDKHINPSLAAHGGYAELVGVEDNKAYLTMGGGCQGCSMSASTLREGISVMVADAIPEIVDVIDVTDHEAGDNPFYS